MIEKDLIEKTSIDYTVNECPHCSKGIKANILELYSDSFDSIFYVYAICECPACNKKFFAEYNYHGYSGVEGFYHQSSTPVYYPTNKKNILIEKEIEELSRNFVKTFQEAVMVEQLNLIDLAGLAYRRAFEFLIKDYVISLTPDKEEEIINDSSVSNIISNRIPETREFVQLKEISKRVWWLGSDYAHYKKHYIDKDILDLKQCIDIVKYQIVMNLRYNHQVASIKKIGKKTKQNR
jgi:hypothetical protein